MAEWFEMFFDGLQGRILACQARGQNGLDAARNVKRWLKLRKGARVMDVPCGLGRLTFPMARMGLKMTGVDLSDSYLRHNKRKARSESLDVRFIVCDMRRIDFEDEFDAVFNWGGSFGYFSDADSLEFCKRAWRALKPGGRLMIEGRNLPRHVADFKPRIESTMGDVRVIQRNRWNARTRTVFSTWTLKSGRKTERRRLAIRIFGGSEIRAMLKAAGFADVRVFASTPPFGRVTNLSKRWIAIGAKPAGKERRL